MTALEVLKKADEKTQFTVFGYIREQQDSLSMNIPENITYSCMGYYFIPEYFDKIKYTDLVNLSDDKMRITYLGKHDWHPNEDNFVQGHQEIKSIAKVVCVWTLKIDKFDPGLFGSVMTFGVVSTKNDNRMCGFNNNHLNWQKNKSEHVKTGDIIKVKLDLTVSNGRLSCIVNDEERRITAAPYGISDDVKYRMALKILNESDCVSLLEYQELHPKINNNC